MILLKSPQETFMIIIHVKHSVAYYFCGNCLLGCCLLGFFNGQKVQKNSIY